MKTLETILTSGLFSFLVTAVIFIVKFIQAAKDRDLKKLKDLAEEAIEFAESKNVDGQSKKEIALAYIQTRCPSVKIKFIFDVASKIIDEIIKLTKTVNARDKDKNSILEKEAA